MGIGIGSIIGIVAFLVVAPVLGCLLAGIDRKLTAGLQGRVGPKLLQPYYDFRKLLDKEDATVNGAQDLYVLLYLVFIVLSGVVFFAGGNFLLCVFILTLGSLFLIVAACFTLNMGMYVYFVIPGFASTLEVSAAMPLLGAFASSAAMAGQTLSKLVLGYVADRRPHLGAIGAVLLGLLGLGMLASSKLINAGALLFCAGAFAYGIFYGVTNVMMPAFTVRAFGVREYPKIYARVSMAASVSAAVSGFLWGTIIDSFGFGPMFAGIAAFMVATVLLFAAMRAAERRLAPQGPSPEHSDPGMA